MESNLPNAKFYDNYNIDNYIKKECEDKELIELKDCSCFKKNSFRFGDILDLDGHRHYGYVFVGKNGVFKNTVRMNNISTEGTTVPIDISKYLTDTVSKYKNIETETSILAYELPYHDKTVQKYNAKKGYMYEYGCWSDKYGFDRDNWYLVQIDVKNGTITKLSKKK